MSCKYSSLEFDGGMEKNVDGKSRWKSQERGILGRWLWNNVRTELVIK